MNNKGFTLIELLTCVAILSILFVVALPRINNAFEDSRADQLGEVRTMIVDATEVYLDSKCGKNSMDLLLEKDSIKIYLNVIKDCGLIKDKIHNPMTDSYVNIDNEYIIASINEIGLIEYELSF